MNIVLVLSLLVAGCSTILARNWPVKDGRPCACNRLHDPVCGSDGQDYPNADCARNCGKVRSFIRGYCDKPALCGCPYNIATVCARRPDGTLDDFDNRCIAECQNGASFLSDGPCPAKPVQPLPDLFAAQLRELRSMGEERVKKDDQVCACPTIYTYSPVCGLKNRIWRDYTSPCLANCAGVESSKPGTCKPKPKPCACGRNYSPVCARKADGTLSDYSNGCVAGCEGAVIVNSGRCQAKPDNSLPHHDKKGLGCACTRIYSPVCAEKDGIKKVYSNKCVARCQGAIYVDDGNCDGPALLRGFRDDRSPAQLPVFPEDLRPAQLPVFPEDLRPAQLPVFPEDLRPAQLPVFPEDLRPAQLPVFPEDLRPAQLPVFPDDADDSDLVANQLPWFNDDSNDSDDSDDSDLVAAQLPNFPSLFKRRAQH